MNRDFNYPKRGSLFVLRYLRLIQSPGIATELSGGAVKLLLKVVLMEDTKQYASAPDFFNSQLQDLFGWSEDKLNRIRLECIKKGWLEYSKGGKGIAGIYCVSVPAHYQKMAESISKIPPQECGDKLGESTGISRGKVQVQAGDKHLPSLPIPKPIPNTFKERKKNSSKGNSSKEIPNASKLNELIDEWNNLPEGIAPRISDHKGRAITQGWRKVQRDSSHRKLFEDVPAVIRAIRGSPFLHGQGWFKLTWLFNQKNGEHNIQKILNGEYHSNENSKQQLNSAQRREQANADAFDAVCGTGSTGSSNALLIETDAAIHPAHVDSMGGIP